MVPPRRSGPDQARRRRPPSWKPPTIAARSSDWAEGSEAALEDSSALAASCYVGRSISVTAWPS